MRALAVLSLVLSTLSLAAPETATVKIVSRRCDGEGTERRGSATLLRDGEHGRGRVYALTSDHVTWHDNASYCHSVRNAAIAGARARFVAAEWGNGLALLEIEEPVPADAAVPFARLVAAAPAAGDGAAVLGFPWAGETLTKDERGTVLAAQSAEPFFLFARLLTVIDGAHGEFGMSGGGAWASDGKLLGVLSHQRIDGTANRLFLVRASLAVAWVAEFLRAPEAFRVFFFQDAEGQQLDNSQHVRSGRMYYHFTCTADGCHPWANVSAFAPRTKPYRDNAGLLSTLESYTAAPALEDYRLASVRLIPDGTTEPWQAKSLAEWFQRFSGGAGFTLHAFHRKFHGDRYEPLSEQEREIAYANTWIQQGLVGKMTPDVTAFLDELTRFDNALASMPRHPPQLPGSPVAGEFFTYRWLQARRDDVRRLRDAPVHAEARRKIEHFSATYRLWTALEKIDKALDLTTIPSR